jgi:hypothetical protein
MGLISKVKACYGMRHLVHLDKMAHFLTEDSNFYKLPISGLPYKLSLFFARRISLCSIGLGCTFKFMLGGEVTLEFDRYCNAFQTILSTMKIKLAIGAGESCRIHGCPTLAHRPEYTRVKHSSSFLGRHCKTPTSTAPTNFYCRKIPNRSRLERACTKYHR